MLRPREHLHWAHVPRTHRSARDSHEALQERSNAAHRSALEQPLQRRALGQHARIAQRILAGAPQQLACGGDGQLRAHQRLLLHQPVEQQCAGDCDRGDRQQHDEHAAAAEPGGQTDRALSILRLCFQAKQPTARSRGAPDTSGPGISGVPCDAGAQLRVAALRAGSWPPA